MPRQSSLSSQGSGELSGVPRRRTGLVVLPKTLLAPSSYRQHWIRYTCLSVAGLWGGAWLFR